MQQHLVLAETITNSIANDARKFSLLHIEFSKFLIFFIFLSLNHHQKRRRASDFGFLKLVEPSILISCTSLLIQASCPICRTSMVNQEDFL